MSKNKNLTGFIQLRFFSSVRKPVTGDVIKFNLICVFFNKNINKETQTVKYKLMKEILKLFVQTRADNILKTKLRELEGVFS